jgi:hypothetical protein
MCIPLLVQYPVWQKMALWQLTIEKRKWNFKCCWKTENVTEVQTSYRNEFRIWYWLSTFWTLVTLSAKYYDSISMCMCELRAWKVCVCFWDTLYFSWTEKINRTCDIFMAVGYNHVSVFVDNGYFFFDLVYVSPVMSALLGILSLYRFGNWPYGSRCSN